MKDRNFTSSNVGDAYYHGCMMAANQYYAPSVEVIDENTDDVGTDDPYIICDILAERYENTLNEMMAQ